MGQAGMMGLGDAGHTGDGSRDQSSRKWKPLACLRCARPACPPHERVVKAKVKGLAGGAGPLEKVASVHLQHAAAPGELAFGAGPVTWLVDFLPSRETSSAGRCRLHPVTRRCRAITPPLPSPPPRPCGTALQTLACALAFSSADSAPSRYSRAACCAVGASSKPAAELAPARTNCRTCVFEGGGWAAGSDRAPSCMGARPSATRHPDKQQWAKRQHAKRMHFAWFDALRPTLGLYGRQPHIY